MQALADLESSRVYDFSQEDLEFEKIAFYKELDMLLNQQSENDRHRRAKSLCVLLDVPGL